MKIHFGHRVGNTELFSDFCAGISPLQLGVVLVLVLSACFSFGELLAKKKYDTNTLCNYVTEFRLSCSCRVTDYFVLSLFSKIQ